MRNWACFTWKGALEMGSLLLLLLLLLLLWLLSCVSMILTESQEEADGEEEAIRLWCGYSANTADHQCGRPPCQTGRTETGECGGSCQHAEGPGVAVLMKNSIMCRIKGLKVGTASLYLFLTLPKEPFHIVHGYHKVWVGFIWVSSSLSHSLCPSLPLSLSMSLSLCLCLSLSVCLSLYVSLSPSLFFSVSVCLSVCLSLALVLSLSLCLSVCLSVSVCLSFSFCVSVSLSVSVSLFIRLPDCLCLLFVWICLTSCLRQLLSSFCWYSCVLWCMVYFLWENLRKNTSRWIFIHNVQKGWTQ